MPARLIPAQRRDAICKYLEAHQFLRSTNLVDMLGVSEATVRRDLDWLEREGIVERTHGGAILSQRMRIEPAYSHSVKAHPEEKNWIGESAAGLVQSGDTVFISSGTTTAQVSKHLRAHTDLTDVTIITNNIMAALEIGDASGFSVILVGGLLRGLANSVVGRFATEVIDQACANKAFIGADGLSLKYGCTSPVSSEAEISKLMIERTLGKIVLVADHSKWGVVSSFEIARLNQFHVLITDQGLSEDARALLKDQPMEVVIAGPEQG